MKPEDVLDSLERRAELGGGEDRLKRQKAAGKLTARERIELLFDPGTFEEVDKLVTHRCRDFGMEEQIVPGDGVVAGHGLVDGRQVFAFAQDFTVFGGSLSETNAAKSVRSWTRDEARLPGRRSTNRRRADSEGGLVAATRHISSQHDGVGRHSSISASWGPARRRR